jgi:hypothetical protein
VSTPPGGGGLRTETCDLFEHLVALVDARLRPHLGEQRAGVAERLFRRGVAERREAAPLTKHGVRMLETASKRAETFHRLAERRLGDPVLAAALQHVCLRRRAQR